MKLPVRRRGAFTLIEVTLALAIAGFCLVVIFGLLPVGQTTTQAALNQTAANGILTSVASDLQATPRGSATSAHLSIPIPASGTSTATLFFNGEGGYNPTAQDDSRYLVTITFPARAGTRTATLANVQVTWPALATVANAAGKVETLIALDRN